MLHVTALALVRERRRVVEPPTSDLEKAAIDVSIDEASSIPSTTAIALNRPAMAVAAVHSQSVASEARGEISPTDSIAPPVDSSIPLVRPLPGNENDVDDGTWTFRSTRDVDLKLGDKTASLGRDMAVHGQLDLPPKKSAAGMAEGLDAIDVQNGFGRAGGVVQAIEAIVSDPSAPPEGVAFFDVAIEKNGKISVSVSESTANREEWERLTSAIAASLKTKDVRFPEQGKGLRVGVRVEAKVRYPDGRDPKKNGTYASSTGLGVHDNHDGTATVELPSLGVGVRGKVCSADVRLTVLGPSITGGCEPANIGVHPERTVAAHETYEQRM